jgi:hypothetical protein
MPGVVAGVFAMREMRREFRQPAKSAHNLAKCEGPPPLAVGPMLGLTRRPRQANAVCETYDFSLYVRNTSIFSSL